ncbi:MAG TPA: WxcM-like domain-containing protein, partial [Chthoniobacterales bacterium]
MPLVLDSYFKHPAALVESSRIGERTRVWAFAHILPGAVLGAECNICDHVFIENDVQIGDRVTIKCGVQVWDGIRIEDDVFVGPNATFTNDAAPRSGHHLPVYPRTLLRKGCSIGANATILPGITIGQRAMVGAGAVVTHDVPPFAKVTGNPARISGYVDTPARPAVPATAGEPGEARVARTTGVAVHKIPVITDLRGSIAVGEIGDALPFVPQRYFIVFDVPGKEVRGEHAHRSGHQFLVCIRGSVSVMSDDGQQREEITLNHPGIGLHLP